jgi:ribosomal protein L40E
VSFLEALADWNALSNAFRVAGVRWDGPSWQAELRTTDSTAVSDLPLAVRQTALDQPVLVTLSMPLPPEVAALSAESVAREFEIRDAVAAIDLARVGIMSCSLGAAGDDLRIEIDVIIYADGFSRHALNAAVQDIVKAYRSIERRLDELTFAAIVAASPSESVPDAEMATAESATTALKCVACGATNPDGSRFCNRCGAAIWGDLR